MNDAGNIVARISDGTSRTIVSSARVSSGSWSHIALTGDGRTMKLYINVSLTEHLQQDMRSQIIPLLNLSLGRHLKPGIILPDRWLM